MPVSIGQVTARKRSGATVVTRVTMRPMNQGTALSVSACSISITNRAANSHLAWRAKCQKNAMSPAGGSGCSGVSVGRSSLSNRANMIPWRPGAVPSWVSVVAGAVQGGACRPVGTAGEGFRVERATAE